MLWISQQTLLSRAIQSLHHVFFFLKNKESNCYFTGYALYTAFGQPFQQLRHPFEEHGSINLIIINKSCNFYYFRPKNNEFTLTFNFFLKFYYYGTEYGLDPASNLLTFYNAMYTKSSLWFVEYHVLSNRTKISIFHVMQKSPEYLY